MKNKILSAFLAVILCCSLLFPATVSAAGFDSSKPHWKASAEVTGRKLTLTVKSVNCAGKLAGGDLCLKYDPDVLKFVKIVKRCQIGMSVSNGTYPIGDNGEGGTGIFANLANVDNIEDDGILYIAEFEILDGKTCGTTPFTPAHIIMTTIAEDGSLQSLVDETGNAAPVDFKCDHADKITTTVPLTGRHGYKTIVSCAACGEVISETETVPHWKASAEVTGRKLTLTVKSVNCAGKLAGGDLCLKYDPDVLKFVKVVKKCQIGVSVCNGTYPIGDNGEGGTGIFANLANAFNIEEDGILYVAEFEILEGKTCGATPFTPAHIMMTTVAEDGSLQSLVDETGNAAPIDFKCDHADKIITTVPATCHTDGKETISCAACGEVINEATLPKGPHDFSVKVSETPATCTKAGKIVLKCSACGGTKEETIAALGHDWDEGVVTTKPTCTTTGKKVFTCKRCSIKKYEIIGTAEGHKFKTTIKEATCATDGLKTERCEICGYTTTTVLPSTGHNFETVTNVIPTYTEPGVTAGKRCKNCGLSLAGGDTIPALRQSVRFYTAIEGINGADTAVNSGYVKVNICFDVLKDELDRNDLEAIAQIYGADLKLTYNNDYFKVTSVDDNSLFTNTTYTDMNTANSYGSIIISRDMDMNINGKTFSKSGNVFATVTLQIDKNAPAAFYNFELNPIYSGATVVASNYDVSAVCEGGSIKVEKLGDANGDGHLSASDVLGISRFIMESTLENSYVAAYDMDKDGYITFIDLDLLRKAIVGNDEYLYLT